MAESRFVVECDAPIEVVFDYLGDHRNAVEYLYGLVDYVPTGEHQYGVGAEFEGTLRLGPMTMKARMRNSEWREPDLLETKAIDGVRSTFRWQLVPLGPDRTRVDALIAFDLPGGAAGRMVEKGLRPFMAAAADHTTTKMAEGAARYSKRRATDG